MRADSDIDFLVDFLPGAPVRLLDLSALMRELGQLVGRRVDVAVKPALKPLIRPGVLGRGSRRVCGVTTSGLATSLMPSTSSSESTGRLFG